MEPAKQALLRQNRVKLVNCLEATDLLPYLLEGNVISDNESERISKGQTQRERVQYLLNLLPKRGPDAFRVFRNALIQTEYDFLDELLTEEEPEEWSEIPEATLLKRPSRRG